MPKPLFWIGPVAIVHSDFYDLFDMRYRQPVYEMTAEATIDLKFLHDVTGEFGTGLFPGERTTKLIGVSICPLEFSTVFAGGTLRLQYTPMQSVTLPNNVTLTGAHLRRILTPDVQQQIASVMRRHPAARVRPGSDLHDEYPEVSRG